MKTITKTRIEEFKDYLMEQEKSKLTIEKYIRDVIKFYNWLDCKEFNKICVLKYKAYLIENYSTASTNFMLSSLNSFFTYLEWFELRVKTIKV